MKKNRIIPVLLMAAFLLFAGACQKMEDFHSKYIKDGEIIYTTKLDSVTTYAGYQRVLIKGILKEAFGVKEIIIYWNDGNDSLITEYTRQHDVDTVEILIENLEEQSYMFDIYTSDGEGHRSVRVQAFGTAYGERYRSALYPRTIKTYYIAGTDTMGLKFLPAEELERHSEVKYTDKDGNEVIINVDITQGSMVLPSYKSGVSIRTWFLPEKTALDSFPSDWRLTEVFIYHSHGSFSHPLTGVRNFSMDKAVVKIDDRNYETDYADMGQYGYRMKLRIFSNDTVAVLPVGETPSNLEPNGTSTFDPATGEFVLKTKYEATLGYRIVEETLTPKND